MHGEMIISTFHLDMGEEGWEGKKHLIEFL